MIVRIKGKLQSPRVKLSNQRKPIRMKVVFAKVLVVTNGMKISNDEEEHYDKLVCPRV